MEVTKSKTKRDSNTKEGMDINVTVEDQPEGDAGTPDTVMSEIQRPIRIRIGSRAPTQNKENEPPVGHA